MATNLWENADLESDYTGWAASNGGLLATSSTKSVQGTSSLRINSAAGDNYAGAKSTTRDVDASTQYTFSIYVNPDVEISIGCTIYDQADGWLQGGNVTCSADTDTRITRTFTTGESATGVYAIVAKNNVNTEEYWYVDAAMLETGGSASAWVDYDAGTTVSFSATVAAVSSTGTPALGVTQNFSATIAAVTTTGAAGDGAWDIGAYIYTGGATGAATLHITHDYSATVAASVTTGTPVLNVATTDEFSATIAAVVTTGTPHLLTGAQLSGIDPTITSATTARTTASSTTARTITSSTTARTIHSK